MKLRVLTIFILITSFSTFSEEKKFITSACKQFNEQSDQSVDCIKNINNSKPIDQGSDVNLLDDHLTQTKIKENLLLKMRQKIKEDHARAKKENKLMTHCLALKVQKENIQLPSNTHFLAKGSLSSHNLGKDLTANCPDISEGILLGVKELWPRILMSRTFDIGPVNQEKKQSTLSGFSSNSHPHSNIHKDLMTEIVSGNSPLSPRAIELIRKNFIKQKSNKAYDRVNDKDVERMFREVLERKNEISKNTTKEINSDFVQIATKYELRGNDPLCAQAAERVSSIRLTEIDKRQKILKELSRSQASFCVSEPGTKFLNQDSTSSKLTQAKNEINKKNYNELIRETSGEIDSLYIQIPFLRFVKPPVKKSVDSLTNRDYADAVLSALEQQRSLLQTAQNQVADFKDEDLIKLFGMPSLLKKVLEDERPLTFNTCSVAENIFKKYENDKFWRDIYIGVGSAVLCGGATIVTGGVGAIACGAIAGSVYTGNEVLDRYSEVKTAKNLRELRSIDVKDLDKAKKALAIELILVPTGAALGAGVGKAVSAGGKKFINSGLVKNRVKKLKKLVETQRLKRSFARGQQFNLTPENFEARIKSLDIDAVIAKSKSYSKEGFTSVHPYKATKEHLYKQLSLYPKPLQKEIFDLLDEVPLDKRLKYLSILTNQGNTKIKNVKSTLARIKNFEKGVLSKKDYLSSLELEIAALTKRIGTTSNSIDKEKYARERSRLMFEAGLIDLDDNLEITGIVSADVHNTWLKSIGREPHSLEGTFNLDLKVKSGKNISICRGASVTNNTLSTITGGYYTSCRKNNYLDKKTLNELLAAPSDTSIEQPLRGFDRFNRFTLEQGDEISFGQNGKVFYGQNTDNPFLRGSGGVGGSVEFFLSRSGQKVDLSKLAGSVRVLPCLRGKANCDNLAKIQSDIRIDTVRSLDKDKAIELLAKKEGEVDRVLDKLNGEMNNYFKGNSIDDINLTKFKTESPELYSALILKNELKLKRNMLDKPLAKFDSDTFKLVQAFDDAKELSSRLDSKLVTAAKSGDIEVMQKLLKDNLEESDFNKQLLANQRSVATITSLRGQSNTQSTTGIADLLVTKVGAAARINDLMLVKEDLFRNLTTVINNLDVDEQVKEKLQVTLKNQLLKN